MSRAYYNENDQFAVAVLREQIASGVIAPGDVDDRSIEEVTADDLKGYTQAHFFAGGGFWSVAARLAGWPDDKPLWTASCPCQPFSVAGKGRGVDDPRHLWPHLFRILRGAKASGFGPPHLVGEQVSGAAGYGWFDGVCADLAQEGYASRARDISACAIDAPHQRNRLFWGALDDSCGEGLEGQRGDGGQSEGRTHSPGSATAPDGVDVAFSDCGRETRRGLFGPDESNSADAKRPRDQLGGSNGGVQSDTACERWREGWAEPEVHGGRGAAAERDALIQSNANSRGRDGRQESTQREKQERAAVERTNGSFWSDYEWIVSPLDGKARRAEPSIPFLVDGVPNRVGLWRVAGGAIVPQIAAEVLKALMESTQ